MSETNSDQPDAVATEQAREGIEQADAGDTAGASQIDQARESNPASAESVEQEASDGPAGRGLAR